MASPWMPDDQQVWPPGPWRPGAVPLVAPQSTGANSPFATPQSMAQAAPQVNLSMLSNPEMASPTKIGSEFNSSRSMTSNRKSQAMRGTLYSPEEMALRTKAAMGITPGRAIDDKGMLRFQEVPHMGPDGRPQLDIDGTSMMDHNPIYDPSRDVADPNHPVQQQLMGLEHMRQLIGQQAKYANPQMDLSPLAALADAWGGGHLAQSYHKPRDYQDTSEKIIGYMDEMQKRRADISTAVRGELAQQKSGTLMDLLYQQMLDKGSVGLKVPDPNKGRGNPVSNVDKFARYAEGRVKKLRDGIRESEKAMQLLNSGTGVGDNAFMGSFTKSTGISPISDTDLKLMGQGNPALIERLKNAYSKAVEGKYSEENRKEYQILLDHMHTLQKDNMTNEQADLRSQGTLWALPQASVDRLILGAPAPAPTGGAGTQKKISTKTEGDKEPSWMDFVKANRAAKAAEKAKQ